MMMVVLTRSRSLRGSIERFAISLLLFQCAERQPVTGTRPPSSHVAADFLADITLTRPREEIPTAVTLGVASVERPTCVLGEGTAVSVLIEMGCCLLALNDNYLQVLPLYCYRACLAILPLDSRAPGGQRRLRRSYKSIQVQLDEVCKSHLLKAIPISGPNN